MGISPVRLNHIVLYVSDLERSLRFYGEVFGMEVVVREPRANAAFLRLPRSGNHHDLGLFGIGGEPSSRRRPSVGLYHAAWQVDTIDELVEARRILIEVGALVGESSHGSTKSLYAVDPDGNEFEVQWMLPRESWGEFEHSAPVEPLDLGAELRKWSGVSTAAEIRPAPAS
jgi:catechol-2,3-dioxygenase